MSTVSLSAAYGVFALESADASCFSQPNFTSASCIVFVHLHVTAHMLPPDVWQVLCLLAGLECFSMPVLISVTAITIGTGLTAFMEVGATTFDLVGFIAFTASAVLEALRVILVQVSHFE